jgi:hypothetical protein
VRGGDNRTGNNELFSYVDLEARVRRDHLLRAIRTIVNEALEALEREFAGLYSPIGRPSIPPEKLLRAMLLQAFYSIRSERLLMERLEYDLLFRWPARTSRCCVAATVRPIVCSVDDSNFTGSCVGREYVTSGSNLVETMRSIKIVRKFVSFTAIVCSILAVSWAGLALLGF